MGRLVFASRSRETFVEVAMFFCSTDFSLWGSPCRTKTLQAEARATARVMILCAEQVEEPCQN